MISEIFKITDDSEVSLTSYISDISEEMKNMKTKPAILVLPAELISSVLTEKRNPLPLLILQRASMRLFLDIPLMKRRHFRRR